MGSIVFRHLSVALGKPGSELHHGVHLRVEAGRISHIGADVPPAERTIDATGLLAVPGLVNCHHHLYQTLTRGMPAVQSAELFPWLKTQYPVWGRMDGEALHVSALVSLTELLLSGCTTVSDMCYVYPHGSDVQLDQVITAAQRLGMRLHAGRGSMSLGQREGGLPPDHVVQDPDTILADTERLVDRYHDPSPEAMVRIDVMPCSPFSVTRALMEASRDLARRRGLLLHTHLAETLDEERFCEARFGVRPLGYMAQLDWLGPDVSFAHGVHFNDAELDLLAASDTAIAHCPSSNMRLGSGMARIAEMRQRGIRVGLAVDGSASNDGNHLLLEARMALLLARLRDGAGAMTPQAALDLATAGGAALLRRPELGQIDVGGLADLALYDMTRIEYAGAVEQDPIGALLLCHPTPPVHVVVNGALRVEHGRVPDLDLPALIAHHNRLVRKLCGHGPDAD
ncbi:MAG: 8-oxoguanine deaminase [Candidatus Sericytochromatia bacterium]|nr:8-oxoguanine deaminase [Candidatus Sericytochromatia bacterium]